MIKINIGTGNTKYYTSIDEAINGLYALKKTEILSKPPRCHKCVYENTCNNFDIDEKSLIL